MSVLVVHSIHFRKVYAIESHVACFDVISDELKDFMGDTVSAQDFEAMFTAIDVDGNGNLDFLVSHEYKNKEWILNWRDTKAHDIILCLYLMFCRSFATSWQRLVQWTWKASNKLK